jgi:hypothetical protein
MEPRFLVFDSFGPHKKSKKEQDKVVDASSKSSIPLSLSFLAVVQDTFNLSMSLSCSVDKIIKNVIR